MHIQMTEEEVRRDVRLAKDPSAQVRILADLNDVPVKAVRRVLGGESWDAVANADKPASKKPKWTSAELMRIKELRARGYSTKQIAEELSRSEAAIGNAVQTNPTIFTEKRPHRTMTVKEIEDAAKYRGKGMSYGKIGKLLGRSGATIREALKRKAAHDVAAS